jgi:two-component system response regulator DevR
VEAQQGDGMDLGRIRVGVLDARDVVRAGTAALLDGRRGIVVVAEFTSSDDLRRWRGPLDVVLVDPQLGGGEPITDDVAAAHDLGARVIALAEHAAPPVVSAASAAGAVGLLLLCAARATLVDAVVATARGEVWSFTVWGAASRASGVGDPRLSCVEQRVLALYAGGLKADAVARTVGLSASTVTTYVSRIRRKYEHVGRVASSRVDLYRLAVEDGVLQPGEAYAVAG